MGPCCGHVACDSLKKHGFCGKWYSCRWVTSTAEKPSDVVRQLRQMVKGRKFQHAGVMTESGVCKILVKVEPSSTALRAHEFYPEQAARSWCRKESRAWHLQCCWDALENDARFWWKTLSREATGGIPFGDEELVFEMLDDVRAAGSRVGEIE